MASIELVKTDLQKELNGVWVDFELGIQLKIARARNSAYRELLKQLTGPRQVEIRKGEMEIDDLEEILMEVRAKTILLDWRNIEDKDGKEIPYSSKQAQAFFKDPELRDFHIFVATVSEDMENFKKELVEDSEKNLPATSDGNSTGDNTKVS